MKQFLPVTLSLLIVACAPPKPGTDAHQRQLVEEARANFYALKEQERLARGGAPRASEDARNQQQQPQRTAKVRLKPFAPAHAPANDTVYEGSKPTPVVKVKPSATPAPKLAAVPKRAPVAKAPKPTPASVARKPAPTPKKVSWFASSTPKPAAQQKAAPKANTKPAPKLFAKATPAPKPAAKVVSKPAPKTKATTVQAKPKKPGDTIYFFDAPQEPDTRHYRAYKAKYAASLGKRPEDLSRKELGWVRTHYRE